MMLVCLGYFITPQMTFAAGNCDGFKPVNEPQDYAKTFSALADGCKIPPQFTRGAKGKYTGLSAFTATSGGGVSYDTNRTPAHGPGRFYRNRACNSYEETHAGGLSDNGADNPCQKGKGTGLFSFDILNHAPTATLEAINCLANLAGAIGGLVSGTGGGDFSGIQASGGASGNCVSGSVGICGLGSIGGSICANNKGGKTNDTKTAADTKNGQPYSRDDPPKYVEATGVVAFDYANNNLNQTSAVYFPQGGVLTYQGTSYTIAAKGFITMDQVGNVYIGTEQGGAYSDPADGIKLKADEFVTVTPTGGIAQVDSYLLRGETIGVPVDLATVGTTKGQKTPAGIKAQINVTTEKTAGATLVPPVEAGVPVGTEVAGSFSPPGTITPVKAPEVVSLLPAAVQESGAIQ